MLCNNIRILLFSGPGGSILTYTHKPAEVSNTRDVDSLEPRVVVDTARNVRIVPFGPWQSSPMRMDDIQLELTLNGQTGQMGQLRQKTTVGLRHPTCRKRTDKSHQVKYIAIRLSTLVEQVVKRDTFRPCKFLPRHRDRGQGIVVVA